MNIQDIKEQLSLIETTLKDINGKLMLELLDAITENRELKEQLTKSNENDYYDYYDECEEEDFTGRFTPETVEITKIEVSISNIAEETMVFAIHPVTGKLICELALYAKRHGNDEWDTPYEFIYRDFPGAVLQTKDRSTDGIRVLTYNLSEPIKITYEKDNYYSYSNRND